jgi:hypothetical protein
MTAPAMRVSTEVPRTLCSSQCRKTWSYKTVFGGTLKDNVVVDCERMPRVGVL